MGSQPWLDVQRRGLRRHGENLSWNRARIRKLWPFEVLCANRLFSRVKCLANVYTFVAAANRGRAVRSGGSTAVRAAGATALTLENPLDGSGDSRP